MKRLILITFACAGLSLLMSGCATTGDFSPNGYAWIRTDKGPGSATFALGDNEGKACAENYLGIYATGDASIQAAKKNGGIKRVATVDYTFTNIIGVYGKVCTIVHGT